MTEPIQAPLVARAQRLVMFSVIAPYVLYLTVIPTVVIREEPNPYGPSAGLFLANAFAIFFGIVGIWIYRGIRRTPTGWQSGGCFYGGFISFNLLPMAFKFKDDLRFERADTRYTVVVVALNIGIVLVSWLPARRAARRVFDNLMSSDVVDSSLIIKFTARGKDIARLRVTPDLLKIEVRPNSGSFTTEGSHPLVDVSAVAVRTETRDGEYPVPGATDKKPIRVTRGEVLVIDLPEGQLVFPEKKDVHRAKQFIEARVRRAAVVDG